MLSEINQARRLNIQNMSNLKSTIKEMIGNSEADFVKMGGGSGEEERKDANEGKCK